MRIAWASCDDFAAQGVGWLRIAESAPDVFISQGDTPYCNGGNNGLWGLTTSPAFSVSTTQADALAKYQQFWAKPGAATLLGRRASAGMLAYYQPDDHEWGGDNWDHTITQANAQTGIGAATQAQVNSHWKACNDALTQFLALSWDNPTPNAAGNTGRPSQSTADGQNPPTSDYPIKYFVRDFDAQGRLVSGPDHTRIIFLDCISYRSPLSAADDDNKRMLGAQQEAWFAQVISAAARVPFVFVASTKKVFRSQGADNGDTFGQYTAERSRLLAAIDASGVKPIWLSGDRHCAHVTESRKSAGAAADLIDICACPIGVEVNGLGQTFGELAWKSHRRVFGLVDVMPDRAVVSVMDALTSSPLWSASFGPGSNYPVYDCTWAGRR